MEKIIDRFWIGILVSSFLGSYLGLPGNQSIFLFRILLILHGILFLFFGKKKWSSFANFRFFLILLGIWLAGNIISLFWAGTSGEALRYIYYVFEVDYLILLIIYYVHDRRSYHLFINVIIIFYLMAICIGIIEVLTGWHMSLSGSLFYETLTSKFQPTAFLFNTNDYAMFLAIFFPLVFVRLWNLNIRPWNVCLAILVLILSFYLVITTYSRLGIVAISLEVCIIFLFYMRRSIVFLTFGIIIYLLVDSYIQTGFLVKIEQIIISAFTKKDASTDDRMNLYQTSWNIVRDSNFLGVGAGNVPIQINNYLIGHESIGHVYRAAHNFWLESLGGIGFFAFAIIIFTLVLFALSIRIWWRNKNKADTIQYLIPLLIVVVFCLSSVGLSTIIEKRYLWLALGIAVKMTDVNFIKGKEG
ncbi:O-antigen ligase family protein [Bacillus cereus]|nr:O-antigen ligase family protein [Bacillus cereus]